MQYTAELVSSLPAVHLGESPCWDEVRQLLWYVDIKGKLLCSFDPQSQQFEHIPMPDMPGMATLCDDGGLIIAAKEVIYHRGIDGVLTELDRQHFPEARYNDGKCDPAGRLWVGTMRLDFGYHASHFYCFEQSTGLRQVFDNITISNGMDWNAARTFMYYIDSSDYNITALDYDINTGEVKNRRAIFKADKAMGLPDGMVLDRNDTIWVAMYDYRMDAGNGRVLHVDPQDGATLDEIIVPDAHFVTSCIFGGADYSDLYITSAKDMSPGDTAICPNAGRVFHVKLPVSGFPVTAFALKS